MRVPAVAQSAGPAVESAAESPGHPSTDPDPTGSAAFAALVAGLISPNPVELGPMPRPVGDPAPSKPGSTTGALTGPVPGARSGTALADALIARLAPPATGTAPGPTGVATVPTGPVTSGAPIPAAATPTGTTTPTAAMPGVDIRMAVTPTGVGPATLVTTLVTPPAETGAVTGAVTRPSGDAPVVPRSGPAAGPVAGPVANLAEDADRARSAAPATAGSLGHDPQLNGAPLPTHQGMSTNSTVSAPVGTPVSTQVLPELARLVSQGDGTHRITLHLQPAALGDVRVVLTVRAGQVHVSLAAGDAARATLLREAPELHRMLDRLGAGQTQIIVRDLSGVQASPTAQLAATPTDGSGNGPTAGQTGAGQAGAGQPQDRRAWTPSATSARDGSTSGPGSSGARSIQPPTLDSTAVLRTAVDVTM